MTYDVDDRVKKEVFAEIMAKRKDAVKTPLLWKKILTCVSWLIFLIPLVLLVKPAMEFISNGWIADFFGLGAILLIAFAVAMFFSIIPRSIKSVVYRKHFMPWYAKYKERVEITDKYIEHGYYNLFWGTRFWTNKIRFNQLLHLEYDDNQKLLRVYGPIEIREWIDSSKSSCWDKSSADPSAGMESWIEIPYYFKNFEALKKELEEKTGKVIVNNEREFMFYK